MIFIPRMHIFPIDVDVINLESVIRSPTLLNWNLYCTATSWLGTGKLHSLQLEWQALNKRRASRPGGHILLFLSRKVSQKRDAHPGLHFRVPLGEAPARLCHPSPCYRNVFRHQSHRITWRCTVETDPGTYVYNLMPHVPSCSMLRSDDFLCAHYGSCLLTSPSSSALLVTQFCRSHTILKDCTMATYSLSLSQNRLMLPFSLLRPNDLLSVLSLRCLCLRLQACASYCLIFVLLYLNKGRT